MAQTDPFREDIPAIRRIAVKLTPLAIAALVQNLVDPHISPSEKRKTAELLLAYGWGRPVPVTHLEDKAASRLVIDAETSAKIAITFDRINLAISNAKISPETQDILAPLLELEDLSLEPPRKSQA